MPDLKSEASLVLEEHRRSIDELHRKLASMPGVDKDRLADAVEKFKAATQRFHDDALACVGM